MGTSVVTSPSKRSRRHISSFAVIGAVVGRLLVGSESATTIHADRNRQSPFRLSVSVIGFQAHESGVGTTDELLLRMRSWVYGLVAGFAVGGGLLGAAIGCAVFRRTTQ